MKLKRAFCNPLLYTLLISEHNSAGDNFKSFIKFLQRMFNCVLANIHSRLY